MPHSFRPWIVAILIAACGGLAAAAAEPPSTSLRIAQDNATVSVFGGDRPLMQYRYTDVPFKPYVEKFFSPRGINVLRDSPHDHKHHHALMFAVAVDRIDFWSENPNCGRQIGRRPGGVKATVRNGRSQATLTQYIDWIAPGADKALLCERRRIDVYREKDAAASLLNWQAQLEPAQGKDSVGLSGSHYFGLGVRLVESMDRVGRFFNSSGKDGQVVRGKERLVRAKWCAYTAPAGGKPVTVAVFDHTANPRHPATFFTMPEHFAYISATLNLWKQPLTIKAGEPLKLRYGVALWDGEVKPEQVEGLYRRWTQLSSADPGE